MVTPEKTDFYLTFFIVLFENMQKYLILTAKYLLCSEGFLFSHCLDASFMWFYFYKIFRRQIHLILFLKTKNRLFDFNKSGQLLSGG